MTHYGFNFLWMNAYQTGWLSHETDERAFDLMAGTGFRLVRVSK